MVRLIITSFSLEVKMVYTLRGDDFSREVSNPTQLHFVMWLANYCMLSVNICDFVTTSSSILLISNLGTAWHHYWYINNNNYVCIYRAINYLFNICMNYVLIIINDWQLTIAG